jgi:hypothetical protein
MWLVSYQNSSRINENNQNSIFTVATGMMMLSCTWLLWHDHINTKMNAKITSVLHFRRSTYALKGKYIIFLIQLVSYQNSFRINENHQNSILIVAMSRMTSCPWLLWHVYIHTKMYANIASVLCFLSSTYA